MNTIESKVFHFFNNKCQNICDIDISDYLDNISSISDEKVYKLLKLDEILINEWNFVLKEKPEINQDNNDIQKTTIFLSKIRSLVTEYHNAKIFFKQSTLAEIDQMNQELGFNLVEPAEIQEMTQSLFDEALPINEAIKILKSKRTSTLICQNFNTINLHNKLIKGKL